jgi:predicted RecB family nuclease
VPGGVLVDLPHNTVPERLAETEQAIERRAPVIYEAAFQADDMFVSVDILERRGTGYCLIEVKSTTSVKQHHLADVAIQAHVLRRSGLDVRRMELMHLNRGCTYPDLSDLFVREDVTTMAEALLPVIPMDVAAQTVMLGGGLPNVPIGDHCSTPYDCPFAQRCWPVLPPYHVSTLYAMRQRALELDEEGYHTIHDLPEDVPLGAIADRQRRAVQTGQVVVEPGLAQALKAFVPPIAFLDFETVGLAVPVWSGCHPYDAVPVQFSCHVVREAGQVVHHEWLAEGPEDPRPVLAERFVEACQAARTVVAYNAPFERSCIERVADAVPRHAGPLHRIVSRLVDLLPVVRSHIYHPDFGGSFSLKKVVPALVPDIRYDGLAVGDGQSASLGLVRLLFLGSSLGETAKEQLRRDLQRYCYQDTWALARLLERLHDLVPWSRSSGRTGQ